MNKAEMVEQVAIRTGLTVRDTRILVEAIFDPDPTVGLIAAELARGEKVAISGFGTFVARSRKARTGRNPQTGAALSIPAMWAPTFKPGKPLKEKLRQTR